MALAARMAARRPCTNWLDDGLSDMVAKFEIPELVLDSEDAEATLTGMTVGGMEIEGLDAVEVKQQMCVRTLE